MNNSIETHRLFLNKSISILRHCGIFDFKDSTSMYRKIFIYFIILFSQSMTLIYGLTIVADAVANCTDLMIVASDGCIIAGWILVYFKIQKSYSVRHKILKLINDIRNPIDVLLKSHDLGVLILVKEYTIFETMDCYLVISCTVFLGTVLIFLSLLTGDLPCRAIFPFDTTISPFFEIAYFIQSYATAFNLVSLMTLEFISLEFLRWTTVQFKILSSNYQNCTSVPLKPILSFGFTRDTIDDITVFNVLNIEDEQKKINSFVAFEEREIDIINDCFKWRFKNCIKHHWRLITIINNLNNTFSSCLMAQLGGSLFIMCLNGYLAVTFSDNKQILVRAVIYLLGGFLHLLYWCALGNELKFQADFLTTSQWMSGWENKYDSSIKNLVTTSMIKTMQPLEMRAGGLFVLTMETFISILKSSYSVFVLLTSVSN
ncbi:uncharacterized protein LOC130672351 [Microplitis mediator]|uniref:uncharacterized protein LOC130672351 n=1 Tax=Microplitis mediator TaxID=375433 RepID=UPI002555B740|nr:uncharacterized protein LOC130672351 [Microplitis mediator]